MRLRIFFATIFAVLTLYSTAFPQVSVFPYIENFDGVTAPELPPQWSTVGFRDTTSAPRSAPNCIYIKGNTTLKTLTSPVFDFTNRYPGKLTFWERRTTPALSYRLELRASTDGITFNLLLARFDTISSPNVYEQRIIDLATKGLQHASIVQFRWILLQDNTNTTGFLRIDDVSLSVITGYDVGLTKMNFIPVSTTRKDSLTFSTLVKNYGSLAASDFSIRFFRDNNSNGIAEPSEQFSIVQGLSLNPGDSLLCTAIHPPLKAGEYRFIAIVDLPQDENRKNDTVRTTVNVGYVKGDLLVNEIMYYPIGDEPEWVELYNASPDTINLKNWKISDSNVSTKSLISQTDVFIAPGSYRIATKDNIFSTIHPGVPFITASFSALNNSTADAVVIYDPQTNTIDSVMYAPSWGGQNGKSLERIDLQSPSTPSSNWGTSKDSLGRSPGKINSIAMLNYDLAIINSTQTLIVLNGKKSSVINVVIKNTGRNFADSVLIRFYADINRNAIAESTELIQTSISPQSLSSGDSIQISETFQQLPSGETNIIIVADWWRDERLRDNQVTITTKVEYESSSIVINEIMYEPLSGQNEWIELFNRSNQPIDLIGWTFNDRPTASGALNSFSITNQSIILRAGDFVIVAADSSIFKLFSNLTYTDSTTRIIILNRSSGFSFNNDGDDIVLKDITGTIIDSVSYSTRYHHPDVTDARGRSLERINPDINSNDSRNWSTCTNITGGTPGKANSILTTSTQKSARISISPNPFSPDGDGFEDFCIIRYNLPMMTSTVNIRIYDIKGRLIRTLANRELSGYSGEIIWDGYGDDKQRARIGVYVIFMEASDRQSGRIETAKTVAVVATKL